MISTAAARAAFFTRPRKVRISDDVTYANDRLRADSFGWKGRADRVACAGGGIPANRVVVGPLTAPVPNVCPACL